MQHNIKMRHAQGLLFKLKSYGVEGNLFPTFGKLP